MLRVSFRGRLKKARHGFSVPGKTGTLSEPLREHKSYIVTGPGRAQTQTDGADGGLHLVSLWVNFCSTQTRPALPLAPNL
jgi:hypothetical protein